MCVETTTVSSVETRVVCICPLLIAIVVRIVTVSDDLDSLLDSALDEYAALQSNAPQSNASSSSHRTSNQSQSTNVNTTALPEDVDAMAQEFLAT